MNNKPLFDPMKIGLRDTHCEGQPCLEVLDYDGIRAHALVFGNRREELVRLFAAAPELLDACAEASKILRRENGGTPFECIIAAGSLLEDAIAKATSKTS